MAVCIPVCARLCHKYILYLYLYLCARMAICIPLCARMAICIPVCAPHRVKARPSARAEQHYRVRERHREQGEDGPHRRAPIRGHLDGRGDRWRVRGARARAYAFPVWPPTRHMHFLYGRPLDTVSRKSVCAGTLRRGTMVPDCLRSRSWPRAPPPACFRRCARGRAAAGAPGARCSAAGRSRARAPSGASSPRTSGCTAWRSRPRTCAHSRMVAACNLCKP